MTLKIGTALCIAIPALATSAHAGLVTFDDEAAFLVATGATAQPAIPDSGSQGGAASLGGLTLTTGPAATDLIFGAAGRTWSDWSTVIPGNALAISGDESFNVDFAAPVASFGFQVHEPSATTNPPDATNTGTFIDSVFDVTVLNGASVVGTASFAPDNDVLTYFGLASTSFFDRVEIVETTGTNDNEYFGAFATGTAPVPLPAGLPLLAGALGAAAVASRRRKTA